MKLRDFMSTYSGNASVSIRGYCEESRYDYYLIPLDEWGKPDEEVFSGNNPNNYVPTCLEKEPWWKTIEKKKVARWGVIGGGMYKTELWIELEDN